MLTKTFFAAEVDVKNQKGYLSEAVTQICFAKKLLHSCFPIKFIRAAFS